MPLQDLVFEHLPLAALRWPASASLERPLGCSFCGVDFNLAFQRDFSPESLPEIRLWPDGTRVRRLDTCAGSQRACRISISSLPDGERLAVLEDVQPFYQDPLTKLDDRRALLLDTAIPRATGSLALLDIDHFKAVNDTLGHAVGDAALCALAGLLSSLAHAWGMRAYRLSGDEFVLLGDTALNTSVFVPLQAAFVQALHHLGERQASSFSYGLAHAPEDGQILMALLARAETRLIACKGRQRRGDGVGQLERMLVRLKADAAASIHSPNYAKAVHSSFAPEKAWAH